MRNKVLLGALILGIGQVGGRILSLIFIFRIAQDLKPIGLHLYTYAYIPFSLFLDLSAFGLIPGVAKCVSKIENEEKRRHILKVGSIFSLVLGVLFFLFLNLFNEKILGVSLYNGYTKAEYLIILNHLKMASISLFIYPLLSFYKGYIQGHQKMLPSAVSILIENGLRILLYLYISRIIDNSLINKIFVVNFISYFISLAYLFVLVFKEYFKKKESFNALANILKTSIPFGVVTLFFTFYQLIDSITLSSLGVEAHVYTAYMFETIRLIFIPIVLAQSVGGAINPKINALCNHNKLDVAKRVAIRLTTIMIYLLVPIVALYKIYSLELYNFFYNNEGLFIVLSDIAILIFFIGFYKVMIGISQGVNKFNYIVISTFIGMIAKIALNYLLVPYYSYQGAIMATIIAIGICLAVSYYILSKSKINILYRNIKSIISSIILVYISAFISTIFRLSFLLPFSPGIEMLGFIIIFVLIYLLFLAMLRVAKHRMIA